MKTEQDIRQMVSTCNNYYGCGACPYNPEDLSKYIGDLWKGGCPNCDKKLVYAMGKGYGDVSEYKAEIERLKSNNGFLQCVISHSKDIMDEAVKQAQIDVLNKVKERAVGFAAIETYHICNLIDELIKEVKNAEDKS